MKDKGFDESVFNTFEVFFGQSTHVSFMQDMRGVIKNCNNTASSTFGFKSSESMLGKTPFDFQCQASENAENFIKLDQVVFQEREALRVIISDLYSYGPDMHVVEKTPIIRSGELLGVLTCGHAIKPSHFLGSIAAHLSSKNKLNYGSTKSVFTIGGNDKKIDLTQKEQECLFYLLHGMTVKDIADILSRSYRTVEKHVFQIRQKMNCDTKGELIEKSIAYGFADKIPLSLLSKPHILFL